VRETDREGFAKLWRGAWALHGKQVSVEMLSVAFAALTPYDLRDIERALTLHVRDRERGQFPPKPADIIDRIAPDPKNDGRPGADEAWSLMPRDERQSAVLTDEMATAMGAAAPLLAEGDAIAARMAFKEVYSREVTAARAAGKPVRWFASMGHETAGREAVVRQAVALGRLSREQAVKHLPHLDDAPMDPNGRKQLAAIKSLLLPKLSPEVRSEAA
jgi:hypothetical protein